MAADVARSSDDGPDMNISHCCSLSGIDRMPKSRAGMRMIG